MNLSPVSSTRTAPPALWRIAGVFLRTLHMLFGDPTAVAERHTLTGKAHAQMASWLRCAEAMLRRLILIEASAIAKPNTRPLLKPRRSRTRKLMMFTPEDPQKWRTSFRLFLDRRHPRRPAPAPAGETLTVRGGPRPFIIRVERPPPHRAQRHDTRTGRKRPAPILRQDRAWRMDEEKLRFRSAWPLAERYEALLRVFNDPAPYARRAAARLHATPHRLAEALRAPPDAAERVENFDEFRECAERSWRLHFSSA